MSTLDRRLHLFTACGLLALIGASVAAADELAAGLASVRPVLSRYCVDCHSGGAAEGDVDLASLTDLASFRRQPGLVQRIEELVVSEQMPPPDADQPTAVEREALGGWLRTFLTTEAQSRAGDPGRVVLRRLNNAEYTYTIRDLTGVVALDPAQEFPADGGAGEGFTNTGQSLVMSPALFAKYLAAAKEIATHAVLLPDGIAFSTGTTRPDKVAEWLGKLKAFYARFTRPLGAAARAEQVTVKHGIRLDLGSDGFLPVEAYLRATLDLKAKADIDAAAITTLADDRGLSPKYLTTLWQTLSAADTGSLLLDRLRARWREATAADTEAIAAEIGRWQDGLWRFNAAGQIGRHLGRQDGPASWQARSVSLVREKAFRVKLPVPPGQNGPQHVTVHLAAGNAGDGGKDDVVIFRRPRLVAAGQEDLLLRSLPNAGAFGLAPDGVAQNDVGPDDLCLRPPCAVTIEIPSGLAAGCELVTTAVLPAGVGPEASIQPWVGVGPAPAVDMSPDAVVIAPEPSRAWNRQSRSFRDFRELFPKAVCYARIVPVDEVVTLNLYYREDGPLQRLLLDDAQVRVLEQLWDELLFVAREPLALEAAFEQLEGYATQDRQDLVTSFTPMRPTITGRASAFRQRLSESEPLHLDAVVAFAGRAFRRPLTAAEENRLRSLYEALRGDSLSHEEAIRTLIAHVLVAPEFLYKLETPGPGSEPQRLSGYELATRLSYFLWSSLPDADLLAAAERGQLDDPAMIRSQVRRMLAAPKSRRLAEQFGLQWLHVSGFSSLDEKNADTFPTFAGLRADMEEETVRFLDDFFRHDRSILSLIDADHTFLNERLAAHYGIEGVTGNAWRRVEGVRRHGRGSILGLATTLSTQSGASRTSPILRGNWLYETILGEKLPRPPKDVPLLAETVPADLTERQLIALHSEHDACGRCHRRIDPYGFALETFDAIGRHRTVDAGGEPLDTSATLPDGTTLDGHQSLRDYLIGPRREQVVRVFCRKLLGYALGRGLQLSDEPLLTEMLGQLAVNDYRISVAIEAIVTSRQFTSVRGRDTAEDDS